jgi:hypothetical protein
LRKKQLQQVNQENIKLYKRLNEIKAVISTDKIVRDSNIHLLDIGTRIKRYRNNKVDPLVSIAKRREREFLSGGVNSQTSLHGSPHFDIDRDERIEYATAGTTDRMGYSPNKRFSNMSKLGGTLPTTQRAGSELGHLKGHTIKP